MQLAGMQGMLSSTIEPFNNSARICRNALHHVTTVNYTHLFRNGRKTFGSITWKVCIHTRNRLLRHYSSRVGVNLKEVHKTSV